MTWQIEFQPAARRELVALDKGIQTRIVRRLARLAEDPKYASNVAAMVGTNQYRLHVGDWRVVYELHDDVLIVLVVRTAHRREVYRA